MRTHLGNYKFRVTGRRYNKNQYGEFSEVSWRDSARYDTAEFGQAILSLPEGHKCRVQEIVVYYARVAYIPANYNPAS